MTYKDDNSASTNYKFTTQEHSPLNLSLFNNVSNLSQVENILYSNGYLTKIDGQKDFKVNLPTNRVS